jgi:hypothetical protein
MKPASVVFGLLLFCSCGSPALITSSWHKRDMPVAQYDNIFVAALTQELSEKQAIENDMEAALKEKGITVEKSIDLYPPKFSSKGPETQNVQISEIAATGAQGLLIIAVRLDKETRFDPLPVWAPTGNDYIAAHPEGFSGMGKFSYNGFYKDYAVYLMETRFYNTQTKQLIWSAESKTYQPNNMAALVKGYVDRIYPKMLKDGVGLVVVNR